MSLPRPVLATAFVIVQTPPVASGYRLLAFITLVVLSRINSPQRLSALEVKSTDMVFSRVQVTNLALE